MPETFILVGDALHRLKDLDDNTFNVCVTSPPYYGLRDYGTAGEWTGSNDPTCEHVKHFRWKQPQGVQGRVDYEEGVREAERLGATMPTINNRYPSAGKAIGNGRFVCELCGAEKIDWQIGLEEDFHEYIDRMVEICKGIKRILRPDGTFFLNIGDSYAASTGSTLKPKNLLMIPARLAIALQSDGWYLRSEIIWHKMSTMPERIDDRPTNAHEKIFLLTKNPHYFFDGFAVENHSVDGNIRSVWTLGPETTPDFHFATFVSEVPRRAILLGLGRAGVCAKCGRPWKSNRGRNWAPSCTCGSVKPVPGMVLDPFLGSGTTAMVANSLGHDCVGIELNPDNAVKARQRILGDGRFSNTVTLDETSAGAEAPAPP